MDDPAERYYPPPQGNMSEIEYEIIKQVTRKQYGFDVSTWQQYMNYLKSYLGAIWERPSNPVHPQ